MYPAENAGKKSLSAVIEAVITVLMTAAVVFMLAIYFSFREAGSTPEVFGYYIFHTHAVNMAPEIPAGTAVFAKKSEIENIGPNSVVLCKIDNTTTLILVVDILEEEGGTFYIVRFKTSPPNETYKIPRESVLAKALFYDEFTGKLIDFGTSKTGIIAAVIVPSLIIVLIQIIRIVSSGKTASEDDYDTEDGQKLAFGKNSDNPSASAAPQSPQTGNVSAKAKAAAEAYSKISEDTAPMIPESARPEKERSSEPLIMPPIRAEFDKDQNKSVLTVDKDGRAEYAPQNAGEEVLLTGDKLYGLPKKSDIESIKGFLNEPVRLASSEAAEKPENSDIKELLTSAAEDFRPAVSDVLPEGLAKLKGLSFSEPEAKKTSAEKKAEKKAAKSEPQPPAEFFSMPQENIPDEKTAVPDEETDNPVVNTDSVPKNAVRPREAIAPRKKQSSGKTIEELMNMIDSEQKKIRRRSARPAEPAPEDISFAPQTEEEVPEDIGISPAQEFYSEPIIPENTEYEPVINDDDPIF